MTFDSRLGSPLPHPERGGENRREKQAVDLPPRLPQEPSVHNPASLTRAAEIVAAWCVQDGVRRVGSGEDGGGECVEGGVVVWMAWLLRCGRGDVGCSKITTAKEKRLSQRIAARMNHTYSL